MAMNYNEWEKSVPDALRADGLWQIKAYRLGLFVGDVGWHDVSKLAQDGRTRPVADQLYRALGSITANLAEGYSYSTGGNRARMFEYALGSARESREWYYKGRHLLGEAVMLHRLQVLSEIIRLLLTMIPEQREHERIRPLHEPAAVYQAEPAASLLPLAEDELATLLNHIPY